MKKILSILAFAFCSIALNAQLTSGLNACYSFGGNVNDEINGLDGTAFNLTAASDHNANANGAWSFDGSITSHLLLPDSSLLETADLSVSCWVNPASASQAYLIFHKNNSGASFEGFALFWSGTSFTFVKNSSGQQAQCADTTTRAIQTWYYLCVTASTDSIKLYVNGVLKAKERAAYPFEYGVGKGFIVGGSNEGFDLPYGGIMDNLRFYDRALSAAEVSDLFTTDPTCFPAGISDEVNNNSTTVFPNPVTGGNIHFTSTEKVERYSILDLSGRVVQSGACKGMNEINLAVPHGFYFLQLANKEGLVSNIKIVVE